MKRPHILVLLLGVGAALPGAPGDDADAPSPTEEQEVMEVIQQHMPDAFSALSELEASDPEAYAKEVRRLHEQIQALRNPADESPERMNRLISRFRLEFLSRILARRIAADPDGPEVEAEVAQLRSMLDDLFELRLWLAELELKSLEADVERLRESLQNRRATKDERIEQQIQAILGGGDG